MKLIKTLGVGLFAMAPITAMAGGVGNNVDVYYVSSGLEVSVPGLGSGDDDGDGFGAKGRFAFSDNLFVSGEYQSVSYDDSDIDYDQLRAGVGINSAVGSQAVFYGLAEYVNADLDDESESGYGVHGGVHFAVTDTFSLNGRIGYIDLGDADGMEYLVGAAFKLTDAFGIVADYRVTNLEEDNADLDIDDLRVGVRFTF